MCSTYFLTMWLSVDAGDHENYLYDVQFPLTEALSPAALSEQVQTRLWDAALRSKSSLISIDLPVLTVMFKV